MFVSYTPDGCNTCRCFDGGLAACTRVFCEDTVDPNQCRSCMDGYVPSTDGLSCVEEEPPCICIALWDPVCCDGETYSNQCTASCECDGEVTKGACPSEPTSCGGIENCLTYTPDGCNRCSCNPDNGLAICTLVFCEDTVDPNECQICVAGYVPSDDGLTCVEDTVDPNECICTSQYDPVCCDGKTYSNDCLARCECDGDIEEGRCGSGCGGIENCLRYFLDVYSLILLFFSKM